MPLILLIAKYTNLFPRDTSLMECSGIQSNKQIGNTLQLNKIKNTRTNNTSRIEPTIEWLINFGLCN